MYNISVLPVSKLLVVYCINDGRHIKKQTFNLRTSCLLYTSDAADE